MNILLISDCKEIGGTEIHIIEFVKMLLEDKNSIDIITTSILSGKLKGLEVNIQEITFEDTFMTANRIKSIKNKVYDVVIAFRWKAIMCSAIAFRSVKTPKIASIHSEFIPGSRYDNENKPDVDKLPKIINKYYKGIITPSEAIKNSLVKYGVEENKIAVIKSFINRCDCKLTKKVINNDNIVLGYFGRLSQEKGVDMLPDICAKLLDKKVEKQWKLYVYGKGELESSLHKVIEKNNLEQRVIIKGFTNKPADEMSKVDILVVPSRQEGLGSVIIEAMKVGVPVVSFRVGGTGELVIDGCNGYLIDQYKLDLFSEKIKILIEDDELRDAMSHEALRTSGEMYDGKKLYNTNKEYILEIINTDK